MYLYLEERLTHRTEHRGALGLGHLLEGFSTTGARLGRAAVDLVLEAEGAGPSVPINVVADGRAAAGDRQGQDLPYAPGQPAALIGPKTGRGRLWMNPGGKENLVRIDIANPGHDMLVEKGRLDRATCPGQGPAQRADIDGQGIRSQV